MASIDYPETGLGATAVLLPIVVSVESTRADMASISLLPRLSPTMAFAKPCHDLHVKRAAVSGLFATTFSLAGRQATCSICYRIPQQKSDISGSDSSARTNPDNVTCRRIFSRNAGRSAWDHSIDGGLSTQVRYVYYIRLYCRYVWCLQITHASKLDYAVRGLSELSMC